MVKGQGNKLTPILVVYKQRPTASRRVPLRAGRAHLETLERLYKVLQEWQVPYRAIPLDQLGTIRQSGLVVTVGGDGTVLATSHYITQQPILGIKSFGETSIGHFCASTAETLEDDLKKILAGRRKPKELNRLAATIDGHLVHELILNDCLFAHGSPAAITNYELSIGQRREAQRSSGIWISTAAGSTAAIYGAGGKQMSLTSDRLQYCVREPYEPHGAYQLTSGVLQAKAVIEIESHIPHGTLSIDGSHIQYPVPEGVKVSIRQAKSPLKIYWR